VATSVGFPESTKFLTGHLIPVYLVMLIGVQCGFPWFAFNVFKNNIESGAFHTCTLDPHFLMETRMRSRNRGSLLRIVHICSNRSAKVQSRPKIFVEMLQMQRRLCPEEGKVAVKLSISLLRVEDISHINPTGAWCRRNTLPRRQRTSRQEFTLRRNRRGRWQRGGDPVAAQPQGGQPDSTVFDRVIDLILVIEHAATCWSYVDHLVEQAPALQKKIGDQIKPCQPVPEPRIDNRTGKQLADAPQRFYGVLLVKILDDGILREEASSNMSAGGVKGSPVPLRSTSDDVAEAESPNPTAAAEPIVCPTLFRSF
jgi:hypothetical protein